MYKHMVLNGLRCTGKTTLFWNLQGELNWPTFSASQFMRDFIRSNRDSPLTDKEIEKELGVQIENRILHISESENSTIIEARAVAYLNKLSDETLKILLTCDFEERVRRSAKREITDPTKAAKRLKKKENEWYTKMKETFPDENILSSDDYDLVIDTTHLTPEQILAKTLTTLRNNPTT